MNISHTSMGNGQEAVRAAREALSAAEKMHSEHQKHFLGKRMPKSQVSPTCATGTTPGPLLVCT